MSVAFARTYTSVPSVRDEAGFGITLLVEEQQLGISRVSHDLHPRGELLDHRAVDADHEQSAAEVDIDNSSDDVTMIGCAFSNSPNSVKIIDLERIVTAERANTTGSDFFRFAHYEKRRTHPSLQGQWLDGAYTWHRDVVIASGGTINLPIPGYVGPGQIRASVQDDPVGSAPFTFEHCTWGVNHWGATLLLGTSRCGVGNLPNSLTLNANGGGFNPMTLHNNLGVAVRVVLSMN